MELNQGSEDKTILKLDRDETFVFSSYLGSFVTRLSLFVASVKGVSAEVEVSGETLAKAAQSMNTRAILISSQAGTTAMGKAKTLQLRHYANQISGHLDIANSIETSK